MLPLYPPLQSALPTISVSGNPFAGKGFGKGGFGKGGFGKGGFGKGADSQRLPWYKLRMTSQKDCVLVFNVFCIPAPWCVFVSKKISYFLVYDKAVMTAATITIITVGPGSFSFRFRSILSSSVTINRYMTGDQVLRSEPGMPDMRRD